MTVLSSPSDRLKPRYDVVIVGSGYGGSVAASRLARANRSVCVLERGREILTGQFPGRFPEIAKEMQVTGSRMRTGSPSALFDVRLGEDLNVLVGCGLGGGSLVNAGVALRPDDRVFADTVWPRQVAEDGLLDAGYATAARWLRPSRHADAATLTKYKTFARASQPLAVSPVAAPVVVTFGEETNAAGIRQPACTLCGDCCAGCNVGAKNTLALSYLPDAVRHGAELFTRTRVRSLARGDDGWSVAFEDVTSGGNGATPERTVSAGIVILAAGTLGSTEILLRSREHGLPVSDRLGHRFSGNGDIIAFGYGARELVNAIGVGHPRRVSGEPVGASVSGQVEICDPDILDHSLTIQEGVLPSALAPILPMLFLPGGRILGALESLIKGVYKGPFANLQTFFAVSHDTSSGQLRLDGDRLAISWPGIADEPVFARLDAALEQIVRAAGGKYVKSPLASTSAGNKPGTAHPLGGAPMGHDASTGVVDHAGRIFDSAGGGSTSVHDGLYVMDGSIIPRSLGVNPLLTITALSERAIDLMARGRGWTYDTGARDRHELTEHLFASRSA